MTRHELEKTFSIDAGDSKRVKALLDGKLPEDAQLPQATQDWIRQCYHRPRNAELIMHALDRLLGGFGVEAIQEESAWIDSYHTDIVAAYINMGDSYAATIVHDSETGEFLITSWGDFIEARE